MKRVIDHLEEISYSQHLLLNHCALLYHILTAAIPVDASTRFFALSGLPPLCTKSFVIPTYIFLMVCDLPTQPPPVRSK